MALVHDVKKVCDRLSTRGWRELLLHHKLDITSMNLKAELSKELDSIDRNVSGFEDFSLEGKRGIEPGNPAKSLLYHALASPKVVTGLTDFPTLAELETVENYIYSINAPTIEKLKSNAENSPLAIVVFATEYRSSSDTVHKKHADVCFSRTGVARVGTAPSKYFGLERGFLPFVDEQPYAIRVLPAKYSAYIAVQRKGNKEEFGPMRFNPDDAALDFWVPLHKVFSGKECIQGLDLELSFNSHHINEKLKRIHMVLGEQTDTGWAKPDINNDPFCFTMGIAELSSEPEHGTGLVIPVVHQTLVERAEYKGALLTFKVPKNEGEFSSLTISPKSNHARRAPEYVHVRHTLTPEGLMMDLNNLKNVKTIVNDGNYEAIHYIDYTGDGWIAAECPELSSLFPHSYSAYSLITAPDFFPSCDQRELMDWTDTLPESLKNDIWARPPRTLSDDRVAANLTLGNGIFSKEDVTVCAIVSLPYEFERKQANIKPTIAKSRHSYLPDAAAGLYAPGWDVSTDEDDKGHRFLAAYGLGSPFPEDAKLCAALSTFWPAVAPDAARTFEPNHWPTVSPLSDEEIGQEGSLPWDGIHGPVEIPEKNRIRYVGFDYADYVQQALDNKFTLSLTGMVNLNEYKERVMAMINAYNALCLNEINSKAAWSVLSFRKLGSEEEELLKAQNQTGHVLTGSLYRFVLYKPGEVFESEDDFAKKEVVIEDKYVLLVDNNKVLAKKSDGNWESKECSVNG